jgi:MATE family multidrug resistance protein
VSRRELVGLAVPVAVSHLSFACMATIDAFFVGHLGPAALAGVGIGALVSTAVLSIPNGLLLGLRVHVSHQVGRGAEERVDAVLRTALLMSAILGLLSAVALAALAPIAAASMASGEAGEAAQSYLRWRAAGAPGYLLYVALRECRYGSGDTASAMRSVIIANAVNAALAAMLIWGLDAGVAGAAAATSIASWLQAFPVARAAPLARALRSRAFEIAPVLRFGGPLSMLEASGWAAQVAVAHVVAQIGDAEMASYHLVHSVARLGLAAAWGLRDACAIVTGQALGAAALERSGRVVRDALRAWAGLAIVLTVLGVANAEALCRAFVGDVAVIAVVQASALPAAVWFVASGARNVLAGALRGEGDVRFVTGIGLASAWSMMLPLSCLLAPALGLAGVWLALAAEAVVAGAILAARWTRRATPALDGGRAVGPAPGDQRRSS